VINRLAFDAQIRDLKAAGCDEIFSERVSAVAQRDHLKEALRFVRRLPNCSPIWALRRQTSLWVMNILNALSDILNMTLGV
jgi:hypothetical protein